ncbi:hypothetical protein H9L39_12023 [Fusarium oxysporum f. sp. albedinis]|nr:hypothetical protein H9L39_12023 [Fusarium oxysporum f. sp. albedinis]
MLLVPQLQPYIVNSLSILHNLILLEATPVTIDNILGPQVNFYTVLKASLKYSEEPISQQITGCVLQARIVLKALSLFQPSSEASTKHISTLS